ncbi:hypothetical protein [Kocuria palustris]|uniref:hypothetical protein n=1 Tax=Kocuria palustris TaxID=71999 RepID=UPI002430AD7F|nr:hypothetical protein [Kocuria palustris]
MSNIHAAEATGVLQAERGRGAGVAAPVLGLSIGYVVVAAGIGPLIAAVPIALTAKSLVFFAAFLPQFVTAAAPLPLWMQLAALGLTWAAMAAVFNVFLCLASPRLLTGQPSAAGIISRITGIAMVAMVLWLVGERIWALAAHSG